MSHTYKKETECLIHKQQNIPFFSPNTRNKNLPVASKGHKKSKKFGLQTLTLKARGKLCKSAPRSKQISVDNYSNLGRSESATKKFKFSEDANLQSSRKKLS